MISVVLVGAERGKREILQRVIDRTEGLQCVDAFSLQWDVCHQVSLLNPQVALVNVGLPDISGNSLIRRLTFQCPDLRVIALGDRSSDQDAVKTFQSGATGYLDKSVFPSRLLEAIHEVVHGGAPLSPGIARQLVDYFNQPKIPLFDLSLREKDVLLHLCEGSSVRAMAASLDVSQNTIRFHLKNIYRKLSVKSRLEAVVLAYRAGVA